MGVLHLGGRSTDMKVDILSMLQNKTNFMNFFNDTAMKKRCLYFLIIPILITVVLSACTMNESLTSSKPVFNDTLPATNSPSPEAFPKPNPANNRAVETILSFENSFSLSEEIDDEKLRDIVRAYFDSKEQKDLFVNSYLNERGMYKPIPDGTYGSGDYCTDYYLNEENRKISFILHVNNNEDTIYSAYCITFSWEDLSNIGNKVYEYDENKNIVFEGVETTSGDYAAYAGYDYFDGIPFPFVDYSYIEYSEFENGHLYENAFHMNQRFWLDKKFAVIDDTGKVKGYSADLYSLWNNQLKTVYNDFVYDEKGRLKSIYEKLPEDNGASITLDYRENDTLSSVVYRFSYVDYEIHHRSAGDSTGEIYYDEQGRMVYKAFYMTSGSHSCFYLYEEDSKTPWAYVKVGGIAYSGDEISEYGYEVSIYLFQSPESQIYAVN